MCDAERSGQQILLVTTRLVCEVVSPTPQIFSLSACFPSAFTIGKRTLKLYTLKIAQKQWFLTLYLAFKAKIAFQYSRARA
jgi:hypothetical protein